ncbi:MAG: TonB-dependent receptor [Mediterranea sp.]|nr:TonB-dependent receptor [Mediterranea sp.]
MKKIISMATLALLVTIGVGAQNIYDAVKFSGNTLNGTARFVGMGGAMGALGGDISTIGVNPAGIGIYRSNDAMTTFSFSAMETKSDFLDSSFKKNKNRFQFDNIGLVFSNKIGEYTPLRYVNFGFSYKRNTSLNKLMSMAGDIPGVNDDYPLSQTNQMVNQANLMYDVGYDIATLGGNLLEDGNVGWLAALGWMGWLYNPVENASGYIGHLPRTYSQFYSKESGGIDEFNFNMSLNISERVYLGFTVGLYEINYKKYSIYDESYPANGDPWGYSLESWNKTDGSGFDLKLGAIVRPFEYSPLRIGVAIHTPTYYTLAHRTSAYLIYDNMENDKGEMVSGEIDTYEKLGGKDASFKYRLQTPWKYNFSLGYTIGANLALGAEYEYQDYSTMKFRYADYQGGSMWWETGTAKDMLKGVSTFRMGAEYKFVPEFALRAGYSLSTSAYKDIAFKELPENSVITDTDYANTKAISNYTFGFGYRGKNFYADLAYRYNTYKEDFYAFYDADVDHQYYENRLPKTYMKNNNHQVLMTLGTRF